MNAIVVEIRDHKKKKVSKNDGCPADKPKFCKPINTCVETGKSCVNKIDGVFTKEKNKKDYLIFLKLFVFFANSKNLVKMSRWLLSVDSDILVYFLIIAGVDVGMQCKGAAGMAVANSTAHPHGHKRDAVWAPARSTY